MADSAYVRDVKDALYAQGFAKSDIEKLFL